MVRANGDERHGYAAAAAAAAFGAPVGEGDAGMRAAAAAAASLGMAMNGGMAIAEALKKMGGGAASESDDGLEVK